MTSLATFERTEELQRLEARIESARAGVGGAVVIDGPAGIGKTTMLDRTIEVARRLGLRRLLARAGQLERDLGWNLVRQLFASVIGASVADRKRLLRGAAGLAAPALGIAAGDATGALHGLYWLVSDLAEQMPSLLAVDDAHWGDVASLMFLAYLVERVRDLPILVVVTVRSGEEVPPPLTVLGSRPATEVMTLRELSAEASAAVVREILGDGAETAFCQACHHATGGNPFLLHELLGQLHRDGVRPTAEHAAEVGAVTPDAVTRSVLVRVSRLSPGARELASAVAVLGDGSVREAADMCEIPASRAGELTDELARADVLRSGGGLGFVHPVVREVIYRELPTHRRAELHAAAARALVRHGERGRAATQLLETEPRGEAWVVNELRDTAVAALAEGAPATAADLLRRAIREPPAESDRADILVTLGRAEAAAGEPGGAERLGHALEITTDPHRRAEILLERGRLLYLTGQTAAAAEAFEAGLRALDRDSTGDPSLTAELQAGWLTVARLEVGLRARAEKLTYEIAANPPAGETYGERALLAHISGQLTFDATPREQALELARRALADGQLLRDETSDGMSWVAAMGALGWGDDFDGFEALLQAGIDDARRRGSVLGYATGIYGLSFSHYYRGMLVDAVADAEQAIAAERDGWRHFLTAARAQLAWALIERGELDTAALQLEQARVDPGLEQISAQALVFEARARIELLRGSPRAALDSALEAKRIFNDEARIPNPSILPWRARAALAAKALGDRDRAEELIDEGLRVARGFGAPRPIGVALTALGIVRGGEGIDALEEAVGILARSPARLELARAQVALGAALRRAGRLAAAREQLRLGLQAAASMGAAVIEDRARAELAAAGARPRRREASGADVLTPAERRVAEAAVQGMTNREIAESLFLSLRTVETHLTHTYQKFGIQARAQLRDALARAPR
jgi:DNA-binding CsgD family transcriptional regulator/tetratricopeptide (TPR) repeat protein